MGRKSVSEMEKRQQIMEKAGKIQYRKMLCILGFFLLPVIGICTFPALAAPPGASQAAIIAGVTSGMSVADIMKNAVSSGMTAGQAVAAMVHAGADPGIVVYEAIHAGYGAEPVVKGAAAAGRQLYCGNALLAPCTSRVCGIVSAAMQNGASEKQVHRWIADAGVPAVAIANAGAQSCLDAAPVEGYSSPKCSSPSPVVGSSNNGYNGGCSGIPMYADCTGKASQHEPDNNGNHNGWDNGNNGNHGNGNNGNHNGCDDGWDDGHNNNNNGKNNSNNGKNNNSGKNDDHGKSYSSNDNHGSSNNKNGKK